LNYVRKAIVHYLFLYATNLCFFSRVSLLEPVFAITANVLVLGAVADFGAQNCQYTTKVDAK
jgi:hypothetical protein